MGGGGDEDEDGRGQLDSGVEGCDKGRASGSAGGGLKLTLQVDRGRHKPRRQNPKIEGSLSGLQVMPSGR